MSSVINEPLSSSFSSPLLSSSNVSLIQPLTSSSPQHVLSTLSRYLTLDSPTLRFLYSMQLTYSALAKHNTSSIITSTQLSAVGNKLTAPHSFILSFYYCEQLHSITLLLQPPSSSNEWKVKEILTSAPQMSLSSLHSTLALSASLDHPLFRTVESLIATLRHILQKDSTNALHAMPWKDDNSSIEYIRQKLTVNEGRGVTSAMVSAAISSLDVKLSFLFAASHSGRACSLANPFPPCFIQLNHKNKHRQINGEKVIGKRQIIHEIEKVEANGIHLEDSDERLIDRNDILPVHIDVKTINDQLPRLENAFKAIPYISHIEINPQSSPSSPYNSQSAINSDSPLIPLPPRTNGDGSSSSLTTSPPRYPLSSLPSDVLALFSTILSSHLTLVPRLVPPNLYTLGHTAAHRQAHALTQGKNYTVVLPDFNYEVISPPDPYFSHQAAIHGTIIAFHGSPLANWHSIIHKGLEVKSGTKESTSGAIYGKGIYFSDDLRVARMFSTVGTGWSKSKTGERIEVVGMYELLNDPTGVKTQRQAKKDNNNNSSSGSNGTTTDNDLQNDDHVPENYYVAQDNSYLRLRNILVWKAPPTGKSESRGYLLLLFYVIILLAIIMSKADWGILSKTARRWIR